MMACGAIRDVLMDCQTCNLSLVSSKIFELVANLFFITRTLAENKFLDEGTLNEYFEFAKEFISREKHPRK